MSRTVRQEWFKQAASQLREAFESGEMTPNEGPVADSSELMHEYEEFAEKFISDLEAKA